MSVHSDFLVSLLVRTKDACFMSGGREPLRMAMTGSAHSPETTMCLPPATPCIPGSGGLAKGLPPPLLAVPGCSGYF